MAAHTKASQVSFFDIIISGGGLSGGLMALSLASLKKADGSRLSIAIVEANHVETSQNKASPVEAKKQILTAEEQSASLFDERVLALSHGSAAYLKKLGVWQAISYEACAIDKIVISDKGYYGKARIEAKKQQVSALGYVVEMALLGKAQLKQLASKDNVHWFTPDTIVAINWQARSSENAQQQANNNSIEIELASKHVLQTKLLLGCDGANSPCRQLAGINIRRSAYQQVALITHVATTNPHNNQAYERFTHTGPIAMLPLSQLRAQSKTDVNTDNRCSLVWTMQPEQSEALLALAEQEFKQQLENTFGHWLGAITFVGKCEVFPLALVQAEQQTYHRMALIGNASHTIHPIAGQGFNLGLRDVQQMRELIEQSLQTQKDIGRFSLLNAYAQMRQRDQKDIIELTDSLVTLFSNDHLPLVAGRNIGLKVMNYFAPLKKTLVHKLMGY